KQHGVPVILNPAPARTLSDKLLSCVSMITPNETEAQALTGITVSDEESATQAAHKLHQHGIERVLITLGKKGAWVSEQGQGQLIAGFRVNAVDTTAAGDTFNGALVTALLEQQPLETAVRFAHAAAAIAVTRMGAQPSVPWRKEIEQFLQQQD
ncbi:MAG: PfkB family carbohydrate kinase, partial [Enterobacteriaceae bacterium]